MRVLYPPDHPTGQKAGDRALILQLRVAGWRILFLGDTGAIPIEWLADNETPETLRSDVLVTGSSLEATDDVSDLLDMVAPRLVIQEAPKQTSDAARPAFLPLPGSVLSARKSGAITLRLYEQKIEAAGFVDGTVARVSH